MSDDDEHDVTAIARSGFARQGRQPCDRPRRGRIGQQLGITTTAEGVETKEQLASLTSEGCNEFQGFLFSRPRPAAGIERIIAAQAPRVEAMA
jgi:hypothetical protein